MENEENNVSDYDLGQTKEAGTGSRRRLRRLVKDDQDGGEAADN
jgi:hypothetical protein